MKRGQVNTQSSTLPATPDFGLLPGEWVDEAACRSSDRPDDWFPGHDASAAAAASVRARLVCRGDVDHPRCPVINQCLKFALDAGPRAAQGIWGGTNDEERKAFIRGRKEAA